MVTTAIGVCAFDKRMLSVLNALCDVQGAPKTALYTNTSEKNKVDELIVRGFIVEQPVPFSNKRFCTISDRGRVLFDALSLVESVWDSDPRSELGFRILASAPEAENTSEPTEPIAKTPTDAEPTDGISEPPEAPQDAIPDAGEAVPAGTADAAEGGEQ